MVSCLSSEVFAFGPLVASFPVCLGLEAASASYRDRWVRFEFSSEARIFQRGGF